MTSFKTSQSQSIESSAILYYMSVTFYLHDYKVWKGNSSRYITSQSEVINQLQIFRSSNRINCFFLRSYDIWNYDMAWYTLSHDKYDEAWWGDLLVSKSFLEKSLRFNTIGNISLEWEKEHLYLSCLPRLPQLTLSILY